MSKVRIYRVPTAAEKAARYTAILGVDYETWCAFDPKMRDGLKAQVDGLLKMASKGTKSVAKERHYAEASGKSLVEWRALGKDDRKKLKKKIDADDKVRREALEQEEKARRRVLREVAEERAAIAKLKSDAAKVKAAKAKGNPVAQGMPGATSQSTVIGLMDSPTNQKWNLFLRDGPYWNYLVSFIQRQKIFRGRQDRVEEAVMNACEKIAAFLVGKRYKYPEAGKGYFRKFIKVVALRKALDLYREIQRQERMCVREDDVADNPILRDTMQTDMLKANALRRCELAKEKEADGLETEISPSESELDAYDASAGIERSPTPQKKAAGKMHNIARLDDNLFSDDEQPNNYDPAAMFDYLTKVSKEDLQWVQKLQIHILHIALGYILTNRTISADRREMLRLRYGMDMKVKDVFAVPRFASRKRNALDALMSHANDDFRAEVKTWWDVAAPDKTDFSNEMVMRFWRDLSRDPARAKIANALRDKAIKIAGHLK